MLPFKVLKGRGVGPGRGGQRTPWPPGELKARMADTHSAGHESHEPEISFAAFVLSLAHTAAVHFGDLPDPSTGQPAAANLPAAQQMIDILALLEQKTRGNLTAEERQLLEQILFELRMRYVEVSKGSAPPPDEPRIIIP
jgi:hypothetical protein